MTKPMRVAIYARVSTTDKGQDPENQLRELRAWCANSSHKVVTEYIEHETGRKGTDTRKQLAALFDAAGKRKFDLVLVWSLDRLSREGTLETMNHLRRFTTYGVAFHSYTEPLLSTDNEMVRDIVLAVLASSAKMEAQKISTRTKAGLARARAQGTTLGRPTVEEAKAGNVAKARRLLGEGKGICKVAKLAGLGVGTVSRLKDELAA